MPHPAPPHRTPAEVATILMLLACAAAPFVWLSLRDVPALTEVDSDVPDPRMAEFLQRSRAEERTKA